MDRVDKILSELVQEDVLSRRQATGLSGQVQRAIDRHNETRDDLISFSDDEDGTDLKTIAENNQGGTGNDGTSRNLPAAQPATSDSSQPVKEGPSSQGVEPIVCPRWLTFGRSGRGPGCYVSQCPYLHYLNPTATREKLECPFWRDGFCKKTIDECLFEHKITRHGETQEKPKRK